MRRLRALVTTAALAAVALPACAAGAAGAAAAAATPLDRAALLRDLETLSADDMQGRMAGTPGGVKARAYIVRRLKESGAAPVGSGYEAPFPFTSRDGRAATGVNVLARLEGRDWGTPRHLVVSAHYDHLGVRNGEVFNGADDNASGTAALFAVARHFSGAPPRHTLILAAFDAEEHGLRGAEAFVRTPPVDRASIALNVNMDMIGRDPDDRLFVVGTYLQPFLKPYIARVAADAPVRLLMGHDDPTQQGVEDWTRDSDHWAFLEAKIPALYFGVEDFGQHHKATDDYRTMTHDFYVRAVETMIRVIRELDDNLAAIQARR